MHDPPHILPIFTRTFSLCARTCVSGRNIYPTPVDESEEKSGAIRKLGATQSGWAVWRASEWNMRPPPSITETSRPGQAD